MLALRRQGPEDLWAFCTASLSNQWVLDSGRDPASKLRWGMIEKSTPPLISGFHTYHTHVCTCETPPHTHTQTQSYAWWHRPSILELRRLRQEERFQPGPHSKTLPTKQLTSQTTKSSTSGRSRREKGEK